MLFERGVVLAWLCFLAFYINMRIDPFVAFILVLMDPQPFIKGHKLRQGPHFKVGVWMYIIIRIGHTFVSKMYSITMR